MNKFPIIKATKRSITKRRLVCGIGVNDADYIVQPSINGVRLTCYFYNTWRGMIQRCYWVKSKIKTPSYKGCTVCDEWLIFSNFRKWMVAQEWENTALDKDVLNIGNKIYSPETCIFVSQGINNLLTNHAAKRGAYPQGVSYDKKSKKLRSQISNNGIIINLGWYDSIEEATKKYNKEKSKYIYEVANNQTCYKLKAGLLLWSMYFKLNLNISENKDNK